jgi:hypothetical protein
MVTLFVILVVVLLLNLIAAAAVWPVLGTRVQTRLRRCLLRAWLVFDRCLLLGWLAVIWYPCWSYGRSASLGMRLHRNQAEVVRLPLLHIVWLAAMLGSGWLLVALLYDMEAIHALALGIGLFLFIDVVAILKATPVLDFIGCSRARGWLQTGVGWFYTAFKPWTWTVGRTAAAWLAQHKVGMLGVLSAAVIWVVLLAALSLPYALTENWAYFLGGELLVEGLAVLAATTPFLRRWGTRCTGIRTFLRRWLRRLAWGWGMDFAQWCADCWNRGGPPTLPATATPRQQVVLAIVPGCVIFWIPPLLALGGILAWFMQPTTTTSAPAPQPAVTATPTPSVTPPPSPTVVNPAPTVVTPTPPVGTPATTVQPKPPVNVTPAGPATAPRHELLARHLVDMVVAYEAKGKWGIEMKIPAGYSDQEVDAALALISKPADAEKAGLPKGYVATRSTRLKGYIRIVSGGDPLGPIFDVP